MTNDITPALLHISELLLVLVAPQQFAWSGLVWPAALTTICHLQTTNQPITVIGSWWFWNYWSSENFIDKACLQSVYYLVLSFNLENCGAHLNLHDYILLWGYLEREFEEDPSVLRAIEICIWDSVRVRTLINSEIRQSLKKDTQCEVWLESVVVCSIWWCCSSWAQPTSPVWLYLPQDNSRNICPCSVSVSATAATSHLLLISKLGRKIYILKNSLRMSLLKCSHYLTAWNMKHETTHIIFNKIFLPGYSRIFRLPKAHSIRDTSEWHGDTGGVML